jgi:hypothetical protein
MFGICCLLGTGGNVGSESACGEDGLFYAWLMPQKTKDLHSVNKNLNSLAL